MSKKYNGWANRETWIVNIWLNSDERCYLWLYGIANRKDINVTKKAEILRDQHIEDAGEATQYTGLLYDLVWQVLYHRVNWEEIIEAAKE